MIRKTITTLLLLLLCGAGAAGQQVKFASEEFAEGVRMHLGLDSAAVVMQSQTDTITAIDLSGLGIRDIRDVVYLPRVRQLRLAYNEITDLSPVVVLDSLRYLDVRGNELEDIDVLALSCSDTMVVDLAYNHILDFGRMTLPSRCRFTFAGRTAQIDPNAPYLDVYQMYTGFDGYKHWVYYRALTNQPVVHVSCGAKQEEAVIDGDLQRMQVQVNLGSTTLARLTADGVRGDSVWVVPPLRLTADGGATITIATGLPADYTIDYVNTRHGTASVDANRVVTYQAPASAPPDTVSFVYFQGHQLRGTARYYINCPLRGDVNGNGVVDIDDLNIVINIMIRKATLTRWPAADLDSNGVVDVDDLNHVINIMVRKE